MNLDENMKPFEYLLLNQSLWCKMYKEQERKKRKERLENIASKNYYGNSSEYKKSWYKNGAQVYK
jgi:hypothetical protein